MPPAENTNQAAPAPSPVPAVSQNKLMAVLSYLGILVFIPFFTSKDDPYVKFHVKQGLVLFGIEVVLMLLSHMAYSLWAIFQLINLAVLVLAIIGIIHAIKGHEKELPLVGGLAKHFKF